LDNPVDPHALADYLRTEPWDSFYFSVPKAAGLVAGMISPVERRMLSWLVGEAYTGRGEIVDLGAFIGSSAVCMATGLARSRAVEKEKRIHSYDRFFGDYPIQWIKENTSFQSDGPSYRNVYNEQIAPFRAAIEVYEGDVVGKSWIGKPIEILFLDILKTPELASSVVTHFFPYLEPGSIVVAQDYLHDALPYTVGVMEHFDDFFERGGDTGRGSVLFVTTQKIPSAGFAWSRLPESLRLQYLVRAADKQRTNLAKEMISRLIGDFVSGKYR
jgi:hypothetical protein